MPTKPSDQPSTLERDPVCGMNVNPGTAKNVYEHDRKNYYFCCAACEKKFKADPKKYLITPPPAKTSGLVMLASAKPATPRSVENLSAGRPQLIKPEPLAAHAAGSQGPAYVCPMCPEVREAKPGACPSCGMALEPDVPVASTHVEYTCPMHPEIVRPGPGSCPICGMALEPMTVSADEEVDPEFDDMIRRFWICLALSAPLLVLSMGEMVPGISLPDFLTGQSLIWIQFALATPVVLWGGLPFF